MTDSSSAATPSKKGESKAKGSKRKAEDSDVRDKSLPIAAEPSSAPPIKKPKNDSSSEEEEKPKPQPEKKKQPKSKGKKKAKPAKAESKKGKIIDGIRWITDTLGVPVDENGGLKGKVSVISWKMGHDASGRWGMHQTEGPPSMEFA